MLDELNRCIYSNNQLAEVICQLRFPQILSIEANIPDKFQDAIRDVFPIYLLRKEKVGENTVNNYQFSSADGVWRINLTANFISLTCSRYTRWEDFAAKLDTPLASFIQIYKPAFLERVGLRYLNLISRNSLSLNHIPFRDLFTPSYLGLLGDEEVNEEAVGRSSVDAEIGLRGGCRAKIHSGPGKVTKNGQTDPEVKFILDLDLFMHGNIPVNTSAGALQTLHSQSYKLFRSAITDILHGALEGN